MRITDIESHTPLVAGLRKDAAAAHDNLVAFAHSDQGNTGTGKTDVKPRIAKTHRGVRYVSRVT